MRQLQNGGSIFNDDEEEIAVTTYITVNTSTLQTDMRVLRVQQNVDSRRQHAQSDDEPGAVAQLGARVELVVGPKVAGEEDLSRDLRACDAQTVIAGDRLGVVCFAVDTHTRTRVAIKVFLEAQQYREELANYHHGGRCAQCSARAAFGVPRKPGTIRECDSDDNNVPGAPQGTHYRQDERQLPAAHARVVEYRTMFSPRTRAIISGLVCAVSVIEGRQVMAPVNDETSEAMVKKYKTIK
ncbi:hypothetical protein CYMTET_5185 [Cymbomonas tetramitiformis]|uniref:Uncharacterized protein n=1 Tax=Cymbomonas tetramitiformis TaxID=36881 RepID=A0AAE0GZZ6_9CHLO|nr:hypothetical protein CYMTET_5185 [Cymbomonas tetramitiformis]